MRGHERVDVAREFRTADDRRIDIVVETPELLLGIENKPWAVQQVNQLADYHAHLEHRSKDSGKQHALIFLSNLQAETARDRIIKILYRSKTAEETCFYSILSSVLASIKAERTRSFVQEFMEYIDGQFGEGSVSKDQDESYVQAVLAEFEAGSANRKALATVLLSQKQLHHRILAEVGESVLAEVLQKVASDIETGHVNARSLTFEAGEVPLTLEHKSETWAFRRPTWPRNCIIGIESEGLQKGVWFGVRAPNPTSEQVTKYPASACLARPSLERLASDVEGSGAANLWWPWWRYAKPANWDYQSAARLVLESPDADIKRHRDIQELAGTIVRLVEAVDHVLAS